jgi:hypothetical protein
MTPDTCPHCGAPLENAYPGYALWLCGSSRIDFAGVGFTKVQSPECARYVRTRISQLKRMADCARSWIAIIDQADRHGAESAWCDRNCPRLERLLTACLREIDRLRGGA